MIKNFPIIAIALVLDGMQAMMTLAFFAVGAGFSVTSLLANAVGWFGVLGVILKGLSVVAGAAGILTSLLGVAISTTMGIVFGAGFYTMLMFSGLTSGRQLLTMRTMPFFIIKFIPFLNILPMFTASAVMNILYKQKMDKQLAARAGGTEEAVGGSVTEEVDIEEEQEQELQLAPAYASAAAPAPANNNQSQRQSLPNFQYKSIAPLYPANQNQPYAKAA